MPGLSFSSHVFNLRNGLYWPIDKSIILDKIVNIKDLTTGNTQLMDPHKKITQQMIDDITNFENINFIQFRDNIYNMFIYHQDITTCYWPLFVIL